MRFTRPRARCSRCTWEFVSNDEVYTSIDVDADGRSRSAKATSGVMFSGSYLFEPELLERLPSGVSELRSALLEPLIAQRKLYAFREDVPWLDTGTIASYAAAQFDLVRLMPVSRELVEVVMREHAPGAWVPRNWRHGSPTLIGPAVLVGRQDECEAIAGTFGPPFAGIEPPPPGMRVPAQNALVHSTHVEKLE